MGRTFTVRLVILRQNHSVFWWTTLATVGPAKLLLRIYGHSRRPRYVCVSQRTTCRSQFSPSTSWVPGIKLKSISLGDKCLYPLYNLTDPQPCFKKSHVIKVIFRLCYKTAFRPATSDLQLQRTGWLYKSWSEHILQFEKQSWNKRCQTFENPKEHVLNSSTQMDWF